MTAKTDMNFRSRLFFAVAAVGASVGATPALAQTVKNATVSGTVSSSCTLSAASVAVTITKNGQGNSPATFATSPTVTAKCNKASGTLTVTTTRPLSSAGAAKDYVLNVSGWGTPANIDTTSALSRQFTESTIKSAALTFTSNTIKNNDFTGLNTQYTATITLSISAAP